MAYKPGDLRMLAACPHPKDEFGRCGNAEVTDYKEDDCEMVVDNRNDYAVLVEGGVYLPHSCDSWVIGGKDQIRLMIQDLEAALAILEGK